jgi:hypothetical protein
MSLKILFVAARTIAWLRVKGAVAEQSRAAPGSPQESGWRRAGTSASGQEQTERSDLPCNAISLQLDRARRSRTSGEDHNHRCDGATWLPSQLRTRLTYKI